MENNINNTINEEIQEEQVYTCYGCCDELDDIHNDEDLRDAIDNEDVFEYEGNLYCIHCRDNEFVWSDEDCEYIHEVDAVKVYTDGYMNNWTYTSERWANNNAFYDEDYQEYFHDIDCGCYTYDGNFICESNYQDNYFYCNGCDEVYPVGEMHEDYENGDNYCDSCYQEQLEEHQQQTRRNLILGYHSFHDWQEYTLKDEHPNYLIGFELEIDNDDDDYNVEEVHDLITSNINCVLMHDGSLSDAGIEIVSQPQSYNYIISQADNYKRCFDNLVSGYGFTSHENGRCGLHFHVTRPSDEVVDRCILLIENFKKEIIDFSRRDASRLSQWASFLSDEICEPHDELLATCTIKKHKDDTQRTRYMALNNINAKTIEFRFCRGTLKYNTFRASLDLINNIMQIASDLSKDINGIKWEDLVNTDACRLYCEEQGITSNTIAIDNTKKIKARNQRIKDQHIKVTKMLSDYQKHLIKEYNSSSRLLSSEPVEMENMAIKIHHLRNQASIISYILGVDASQDVQNYIYQLQRILQNVASKYYRTKISKQIEEVKASCVL